MIPSCMQAPPEIPGMYEVYGDEFGTTFVQAESVYMVPLRPQDPPLVAGVGY